MAARDGLLRPEELVGGLAICEATAKVVSCGCRHSESRRVPAKGHGGFGYGGPQSCRRTSSLLATVRLDGIFTADSKNAYLFSVNFHGR